MKLDLDDIERKAGVIAAWDEQVDAEEQACVSCRSHVHTPVDLDPTPLCDLCAQAHATAIAPVTLALVARIRELEIAIAESRSGRSGAP